MNLWPPEGFAAGVFGTSASPSRRLQEQDTTSECAFSETEGSDIGMLVFIGNLVLVVGILLGVFFLHIAVVSAIEACWLVKVRPVYTSRLA